MDIIIVSNVMHEDLPSVARILADAGIGSTVPTPNVLPTPVVDQVAQPTPSGSDPASAARAARTFYADVAKALGISKLTSVQQAEAKSRRKAGATVVQVARILGTGDGQAEAPAPVDPQAARMAALEAELASMRGTPATWSPIDEATTARTVVAPTSGAARTAMPDVGALLSPSERQALLTWADVTLAHPARKAAVQQYCGGTATWAQAAEVGVKAKSALRVLATHNA